MPYYFPNNLKCAITLDTQIHTPESLLNKTSNPHENDFLIHVLYEDLLFVYADVNATDCLIS